jgi:hypothetical protein
VTLQEVPGGAVKRIRVGRFESVEEAERAARDISRKLRGWGVNPLVTRIR